MKKINWTAVIIVCIVMLFILLVGSSLLAGRRYVGWGMMGPGMMGGWGHGLFGWMGMLLMGIFPLSLIVLVALGIAWLVRDLSGGKTVTQQRSCPNCARVVQTDWQHCPYCGTGLT